jgi:hypothetical protein
MARLRAKRCHHFTGWREGAVYGPARWLRGVGLAGALTGAFEVAFGAAAGWRFARGGCGESAASQRP